MLLFWRNVLKFRGEVAGTFECKIRRPVGLKALLVDESSDLNVVCGRRCMVVGVKRKDVM
jgi:hypothetical protein